MDERDVTEPAAPAGERPEQPQPGSGPQAGPPVTADRAQGRTGERPAGDVVAPVRTIQLEQLAAARTALNTAERACAILRGAHVRDRELNDAVSRIHEAHGLLWRLGRLVAGEEERYAGAPLKMSIDYVAWVLADRTVDHWTAELLRLMAKADPGKLAQLAEAFPEEHAALKAWHAAPFGDVEGASKEGDDVG